MLNKWKQLINLGESGSIMLRKTLRTPAFAILYTLLFIVIFYGGSLLNGDQLAFGEMLVTGLAFLACYIFLQLTSKRESRFQ